MNFNYIHTNFNVLNLEKSIEFYSRALGLKEVKRMEPDGADFTIVYLGRESASEIGLIELTWLHDRTEPYSLGDNEVHIAFKVDDPDAAYEYHKAMGVISYENETMHMYFIEDPDGNQIEILPPRKQI